MKRGGGKRDEDEERKKVQRLSTVTRANDNPRLSLGQSQDSLDLSQERQFEVPSRKLDMRGRLERIQLKNFMCHSNMNFDFEQGDNFINFIVGKNGSGKSAIMTALIVGLGGKATVTGRANSIKGFIKTGKQSAEVSIRLTNTGEQPYKPEIYGPSITVVRKFSQDGASQYQIRNSQGKLISNKKGELVNVIEWFQIQVDNPVVVLNQDASKYFLNSNKSTDKYKFFMRATTLDQVLNDYVEAGQYRDKTVKIVEQKKKVLPLLEIELKKLERRYKSLQSLDNLRQKVMDLRDEQAWAIIVVKEKEGEILKKKLQDNMKRMPKFDDKVRECEGKVGAVNEQLEAMRDDHKALVEEQKALVPSYKEAINAATEKKAVLRIGQNEIKKVEGEVRNCKKDYEQIREKIEEIKHTQQRDYEAERRERNEKIQALVQKHDEAACQQTTRKNDITQFEAEVSRYRAEGSKIESDLRGCTYNLDKLNDERKKLLGARGHVLKRYGGDMPNVVAKIDAAYRAGKFHERPRGPIGACIKLRDYKWALAIETCIRGMLFSFCVHDHDDCAVLNKIFQQSRLAQRPAIIISKYKNQVHDVSRFQPALTQFPSVFDMIDTDDVVILNTLIDQRMVENIILIEDEEQAVRIMRTSQPENVKEVYTSLGSQLFCRPTFRFYSGQQNRAQYLSESVEEAITGLETQIQGIQENMEELRSVKAGVLEGVRSNETKRRQSEGQLQKLNSAINKLNNDIGELRNVEEPIPVDIKTLEEDADNLKQRIQTLGDSRDEKMARQEVGKREYTKSEAEKQRLHNQIKGLEEQEEPLKNRQNELRCQAKEAESHQKHYEEKRGELQTIIEGCEGAVAEFSVQLESDLEKARSVHTDRIQTTRMPVKIQDEIVQIQTRIDEEQNQHGDIDEIATELQSKREVYDEARKHILSMRNFVTKLTEALKIRKNTFEKFRSHIAIRVKINFLKMLQERNFSGKMVLNHDESTLEMHIQPNAGEAATSQELRSLSGGERSFTTVAFVLALWRVMPSPFRALDEFDVYMDMVNRKVSLELLIQQARAAKKQVIFLTPQDMSTMHDMSNITINRMQDPERRA